MDVIDVCDALADDSDAFSLSPAERQRLVDVVERAVAADLQHWCEAAGGLDERPEAAFDRTTALMEVAEVTMVCYLAQRYGLSSDTPLSWTPDFMPVRWRTTSERDRAISYLIEQRTHLLRKEGRTKAAASQV